MRSWKVTQLGEPEDVLKIFEDEPKPTVGADELLVKVEATALNFFDILLCQGKYQERPEIPFTIGAEISGVVEEVGENVSTFAKGQRILGSPKLPAGGLSEYVVVKQVNAYAAPDSMSFEEAAALYMTYQTSYYALFNRVQLKKGDVLLVHAASGGVGSAAVQLGKAVGATVIATVGSDEKVKVCEEMGADHVINYQKENFVDVVNEITNKRGADIIYDPVGGDVFHGSRRCIAFDGRILIVGFAGGTIADAPTNHALVKNYSIVGVHYGYFARLFPDGPHKQHEELMKLYNEGLIKPLIYDVFPFEEVPKALNLLGSRGTWGKVIIKN